MSQIIRGIVLIFFCSYATSSPLPQEVQQEVAMNTVVQQQPTEGQLLVNHITPYASYVYHGHHNANSFKVLQQPQIQIQPQQPQVLLHQPFGFGAMPVQQTVEQMKQSVDMKMTEENKDMAQKNVPLLHHVPLNYLQYIPQYQPQYQPLFQYYPTNPYFQQQQQYVLVPLAQQAKSEIHDQMSAPNKEMKMSDDTIELRSENVENDDVEVEEPEPKIGSAEAIEIPSFDGDDNEDN